MPTSRPTITPPGADRTRPPTPRRIPRLESVARAVVGCTTCPRLRRYCERIGREKRAAFRDETYWARPVPGFGDPRARIALVGLAPAAHGANRTGRMFTGDGTGGSSEFLMAALHACGLASQPHSSARDDGLTLDDVWITAAVRCAPPDNKPTPAEIANCAPHLRVELSALPRLRVYVALGRLAFTACLRLLDPDRHEGGRRPVFAHGAIVRWPGGPTLIASYHPSRQNTHTGRLTPAMLRAVIRRAKATASQNGA